MTKTPSVEESIEELFGKDPLRSRSFENKIKKALTEQREAGARELLPYLKAYKQTLDSDWSLNPVQSTTLVYTTPEQSLRNQADAIERKRAESIELEKLIEALTPPTH